MQTLFWTVANTDDSLTVVHPQKHSHPEAPPRSAHTNTEPDTDNLEIFSGEGGGRGGISFIVMKTSKF